MTDFNLDSYDELAQSQEDGAVFSVLRPGTSDVLFDITVHGPDSERQRRAHERATEEHLARGANTPLSKEESLATSCLFLARCCSAWTLKDRDGQYVHFTEELAAELFTRYKAVREGVDNMAANRLRFIKRSPTA